MSDIGDDITFTPAITLTQAMTDPALFGKTFRAPSFWTWKTVAKVIDDLPLDARELELFRQCTGRTRLPNRHDRRRLRRLILLAGRRAGKDRFFSAVAVWRAALCAPWRKLSSEGEQQVVLLLGADRKQAGILRRYCEGLLKAPLLAQEIVRQTTEVIEFRGGGMLEIATNDARLVRGRSAIAVIGSEASHWQQDEASASSDEEVVGAAEPSMAMCADGGILCLGSSVYRKRGYMYRQYKKLHGNDEVDDLCWFAPSTVMNPKLPQRVVDDALADNPQKAGAEYMGLWREDISDFLPLDVVEACTDYDTYVRLPNPNTSHVAFVDGAGGTGKDSYAFAIAHCDYETDTVTLDFLHEWRPPFIPSDVVAACSNIMSEYQVHEVRGDKYAAGFHASLWERNGKIFVDAEYTTSDYYLRALPIFLARRAKLLDDAKLRSQLVSLERHVLSAREVVRHPQIASAHDDLASAACGALVTGASRLAYDFSMAWISGADTEQKPDAGRERVAQFSALLNGLATDARGYGGDRIAETRALFGPRFMNWR